MIDIDTLISNKVALIHKIDHDKDKVDATIEFARQYYSVADDRVFKLLNTAISFCKDPLSSNYLILNIYIAFYHLHYENRDKSYTICNSSWTRLFQLKNYREFGLCTMIKAHIMWHQGKLNDAIIFLENTTNLLKSRKRNSQALYFIYCIRGIFYFDMNEFSIAKKNYKLSLKAYKTVFDEGMKLYAEIGLASIYRIRSSNRKAIELLKRMLGYENLNYRWSIESRINFELGLNHAQIGNIVQAKKFLEESYLIRKKNDAYPGIVSSLIEFSKLLIEENEYDQAQLYLEEALEICRSKNFVKKQPIILTKLSEVLEYKQDFQSSLNFLKASNSIEKSMIESEIFIKSQFFKLKIANKKFEFEEYNKISKYLNVINAFALSFLKTKTIDEIVWTVAREAIGKMGYVDCVVYLMDEKGDHLIQRAAWGPKNPVEFDIYQPIKLNVGQGIVGHVALTGIGEIIPDTSMDERYYLDDSARASEITVPILSKGKVIGIIDSEHPEVGFFKEEDLKVLNTIAAMTSTRLDQVNAMNELSHYHESLENQVAQKTIELTKALERIQKNNKELNILNKEKDILLKEVHHRVKNNLQIITSLLSLQALDIKDEKVNKVFKDSQYRINAMALVHEMLYQSENLSLVDYGKYIERLVYSLVSSYSDGIHEVKLDFDLPKLLLSIDVAIPLGIMINEIITNSMKYAFKDTEMRLIYIYIKELSKNSYTLRIGDNGSGYEDALFHGRSSSLGMKLIQNLTIQINGTIQKNTQKKGTHYLINFQDHIH